MTTTDIAKRLRARAGVEERASRPMRRVSTEHREHEHAARVLREEADAIEALPVVRLPVLKSCGDCGHFRPHKCAHCSGPDRCVCGYVPPGRELPEEDVIPEWCRLLPKETP